MNREAAYGNSLRKLKEIRDELEQRQVDMDALEKELEEGYANIRDLENMLNEKNASAESIRKGLEHEMKRYNHLHPSLNAQQLLHRNINGRSPEEDALRVKLLPPRVGWDEEHDRAYVKLAFSYNGYPEMEVYALSLGQLDYIDEDVQVGLVKEMAEHINHELWQIVKKRNKDG